MLLLRGSRAQCVRCRLEAQIRHASLIRRPRRPYTFTQLITLSDGSTFLHRTTSPQPIFRSTKDTKNTALWNPTSQTLLNVEEDEAGRLRRFRERFGRGYDAEAAAADEEESDGEERVDDAQEDDNLLDLISNYGRGAEEQDTTAGGREPAVRNTKGKGGKK